MDKNSIMSQTEKYRQEMMKLYGRRTADTEEETAPQPIREEQPIEEANEDFAPISQDESILNESELSLTDEDEIFPDENQMISEEVPLSTVDERYPDPILDEIRNNDNVEYTDEEYMSSNGYDSVGWISVDVQTGERANPVIGASVVITSMEDGKLLFKASGVTNESGQIFKIPLPAPSASLSLDSGNKIKPYSVYDVSVYADGFFRARSIDVPVFSGITSIQLFNLVPLPLYMKEGDEIITYYNQEPELQ